MHSVKNKKIGLLLGKCGTIKNGVLCIRSCLVICHYVSGHINTGLLPTQNFPVERREEAPGAGQRPCRKDQHVQTHKHQDC